MSQPDLHILGHWSYPEGANVKKTVKPIYVIANTSSVELFVNGRSYGVNSSAENGYVFVFPGKEFSPGRLRAIGRNAGKVATQHELVTAGAATRIKLTPILGPSGLRADGEDVALIDVEIVDGKGRRCPTADLRIDFTCTGPAIWRGGYNSGTLDSTNHLYLSTELGINRIAVRSTLSPGTIVVSASHPGLRTARLEIAARAVGLNHGIATWLPRHGAGRLSRSEIYGPLG